MKEIREIRMVLRKAVDEAKTEEERKIARTALREFRETRFKLLDSSNREEMQVKMLEKYKHIVS